MSNVINIETAKEGVSSADFTEALNTGIDEMFAKLEQESDFDSEALMNGLLDAVADNDPAGFQQIKTIMKDLSENHPGGDWDASEIEKIVVNSMSEEVQDNLAEEFYKASRVISLEVLDQVDVSEDEVLLRMIPIMSEHPFFFASSVMDCQEKRRTGNRVANYLVNAINQEEK